MLATTLYMQRGYSYTLLTDDINLCTPLPTYCTADIKGHCRHYYVLCVGTNKGLDHIAAGCTLHHHSIPFIVHCTNEEKMWHIPRVLPQQLSHHTSHSTASLALIIVSMDILGSHYA